MHTSNSHWILVSNVLGREHSNDIVNIYDSLYSTTVSAAIKKQVCSFMKPMVDSLRFDIMNIECQTNSFDCGVYSLACATEIINGADPVLCKWDYQNMRQHLLSCLEVGSMTRFPVLGNRCIRFGMRVQKSILETIYCICRKPNNKDMAMIECTSCCKWFHTDCIRMSIEVDKSYRESGHVVIVYTV